MYFCNANDIAFATSLSTTDVYSSIKIVSPSVADETKYARYARYCSPLLNKRNGLNQVGTDDNPMDVKTLVASSGYNQSKLDISGLSSSNLTSLLPPNSFNIVDLPLPLPP